MPTLAGALLQSNALETRLSSDSRRRMETYRTGARTAGLRKCTRNVESQIEKETEFTVDMKLMSNLRRKSEQRSSSMCLRSPIRATL